MVVHELVEAEKGAVAARTVLIKRRPIAEIAEPKCDGKDDPDTKPRCRLSFCELVRPCKACGVEVEGHEVELDDQEVDLVSATRGCGVSSELYLDFGRRFLNDSGIWIQ